ncbi:unnamed protein product [Polarella glacialis]|uniref:SET domain-containing protein n=1 Tax=Polarella glacialis TaxID=89957 RepID=A0A813LKN5_POLGL|nr:unnamed protein product [Polarella glacialis]
MHGADWLPTLCAVAGISGACESVALDGVDQGGPLFRNSEAVRTEVFYGQGDNSPSRYAPYDTALRDGDGLKLFQGWGGLPANWSRAKNASCPGAAEMTDLLLPSSSSTSATLLYNVRQDPGEHVEVSQGHPEIVARLVARLNELRSSAVDVVGGGGHPDPKCPSYDKAQHTEPHVGAIWVLLRWDANRFKSTDGPASFREGCMIDVMSIDRMNHSCRPSVSAVRELEAFEEGAVKTGEGRFVARALRDLAVGDTLCLNYGPPELPDWALERRRQHLLENNGFVCQCPRCTAEDAEALDGGSLMG